MQVVEIGKSAEGRPQLMSIISSPENMKRLHAFFDYALKGLDNEVKHWPKVQVEGHVSSPGVNPDA